MDREIALPDGRSRAMVFAPPLSATGSNNKHTALIPDLNPNTSQTSLIELYWPQEDVMKVVYSTYEAKAKFSEVLRKVRAGRRIVIAYRGEEIAEIRSIDKSGLRLEESLSDLETNGILSSYPEKRGRLGPIALRSGALARFLESRE
jgi:prevent-host-death family protein